MPCCVALGRALDLGLISRLGPAVDREGVTALILILSGDSNLGPKAFSLLEFEIAT